MNGILVGVDGSDHSEQALEWAAREAALRGAPLTVLTVQQVMAGYSGTVVPYPGDRELAEQARQAAQEQTDKVIAQLTGTNRPASVTVQSVAGLPVQALLAAAEGADMIVLGSRGVGGFRRLLLGSVAQQVTQGAKVPVVVIPAQAD